MNTALTKALHSSIWDRSALRGTLVLQDEVNGPLGNYQVFSFAYTTESGDGASRSRQLYINSMLRNSSITAIAISLAVGLLFGIIILFFLTRRLQQWHSEWLRGQRANLKMVLLRQRAAAAASHAQQRATEVEINEEVERELAPSTRRDPFEMFMTLIRISVRRVLLHYFVDSVEVSLLHVLSVTPVLSVSTTSALGATRVTPPPPLHRSS